MTDHADAHSEPVVLTVVPSEMEAEIIVSRLKGEGIVAQAAGGLTGSFRAEAPGGVKVLVRAADAERAKALLAEAAE